MGRTARNRNDVLRPKPVQKIELSSRKTGWRLLAVVLLLAVGAAALSYGVMNLFSSEPGWVEIEANAGALSVAGDFVFLYDVGVSGASATAEKRALTTLYTDLTRKAWQLFNNEETTEGVPGVRYLNDHPNEAVEVDPALYRALERAEASGSRYLYLAPIADIYDNLFACEDDALAADFDPLLNDGLRRLFAEIAVFAANPEAARVELLGANRVCLRVSDDYLAFARAEELDGFIDFHWMLNAFVIDYLADELTARGYTLAALSSRDGFARALDGRDGASFSYNLYDRGYLAAVMSHTGARSIVALRGYPLTNLDGDRYAVRRDGEIRVPYLDPADGLPRAAAADLVACAGDRGCADILLALAPAYIADTLDRSALLALEGVQSILVADGTLLLSDPALTLSGLAEGYAAAPME